MTNLEKFSLLINVTGQEALLSLLLDKAEEYIKLYTRLETVPIQLNTLIVDIAIIYYNRLGTEGEHSRTEGGISQTFGDDLPKSITQRLDSYRKVGVMVEIDEETA